jgi:nucleotide-binding universal stress UspA family protein
MKRFKKIVVGVDYSDASIQALKQAGRIASAEGSELVALHVVVPSEIEEYNRYFTIPSDAVLDACRRELADLILNKLGRDVAATSSCEAIVGIPYHDLINWAAENGCDLLVLGSQGESSGPHDVGYFASRCVRHSPMPILLTRGHHSGPFKSVVACVDFSESSKQVLDTAAEIAADEGAGLQVAHAVRPPWMRPTHVLYNTQTVEDDAYKAQYRELLEAEMQAACKPLPAGTKPHIIEHENVSQALIHFLRESDAELAVLGRSGHTAKVIKQFFLGTTAERLIHHSPCSVLVLPPQ